MESIIIPEMRGALDSGEVKKMCVEAGFDRASIIDPSGADIKTDYPRVIVLAMITPDESAEYTFKAEIEGRLRWSKWIYEALENRSRRLVSELHSRGIEAEPLEFRRSWEKIDLKRAAVAGGLGVMGENNLVLNREWGPRMRFTAVFADLDTEVDKPSRDEICNMCAICIRECPTGALDSIEFDRSRCIAEFDPDSSMRKLQEEMVEEITDHVRAQCSICITSCPYGMFGDVRRSPGF